MGTENKQESHILYQLSGSQPLVQFDDLRSSGTALTHSFVCSRWKSSPGTDTRMALIPAWHWYWTGTDHGSGTDHYPDTDTARAFEQSARSVFWCGQQFVRVEHVRVNDGGQAVIGNMKEPDTASTRWLL